MGIRFISSLLKKRLLYLLTVILALSGYPAVYAIEIIAEDVSNKVVSCDSPLLEGKPPGTCIAIPDGTLFITVTLEEGDNPDILDNMHIAIRSEGRNYQYQPKSTSSELCGYSSFSICSKDVTAPVSATLSMTEFSLLISSEDSS